MGLGNQETKNQETNNVFIIWCDVCRGLDGSDIAVCCRFQEI